MCQLFVPDFSNKVKAQYFAIKKACMGLRDMSTILSSQGCWTASGHLGQRASSINVLAIYIAISLWLGGYIDIAGHGLELCPDYQPNVMPLSVHSRHVIGWQSVSQNDSK